MYFTIGKIRIFHFIPTLSVGITEKRLISFLPKTSNENCLEVYSITCESGCDSNGAAIYMCTSDEELTLKAYIVS